MQYQVFEEACHGLMVLMDAELAYSSAYSALYIYTDYLIQAATSIDICDNSIRVRRRRRKPHRPSQERVWWTLLCARFDGYKDADSRFNSAWMYWFRKSNLSHVIPMTYRRLMVLIVDLSRCRSANSEKEQAALQ
nr:hypothetical protein CFP56_71725 [Quercus suber]